MAPDPTLLTRNGPNQNLLIPVKGQNAKDFNLSIKFKRLEAGGVYTFLRQQIFYTISTNGALSGSGTVVVDEAITSETPPFAVIFLNDGTGFDEYTYSSLDTSTRTFTLDTAAHPSGLTKTYATGNEAKLESENPIEIDCSSATFQYDAAGANDQIVIRAKGSEVDLIIPSSLPTADYSQTVSTTPIYFQTSVGAFFTPGDLTYDNIVEWRADGAFWDGTHWGSVDSNYRLRRTTGTGAMVTGAQNYFGLFSNTSLTMEFFDGTTWVNAFASGDLISAIYLGVADVAGGRSLLDDSNGNDIDINDIGSRSARNGHRLELNWNGVTSGGSMIANSDAITNYNHDAVNGTQAPTSGAVILAGFNGNDASNSAWIVGDGSFTAAKVVSIIYIKNSTSIPEADRQKLMRYTGFALEDRRWTNPVSNTLPDFNVRPLGGTSAVLNLAVPTLTLTISNIPETAEVRIYDLDGALPDFGTELAGIEDLVGTSFEYSHSKSGDDIMLQIFADGFKELNQPITLSSVSQTVNAAELLEAEDAL